MYRNDEMSSTMSYKFVTLFENESITDINYPELLTAFYHYIIYMHIKKAYKN